MKIINYKVKARTTVTGLRNSIGKNVTVCGMVYRIRKMSAFAFVILQTEDGLVQCVYLPDCARFPLDSIAENMSVSVFGTVVADERCRQGFEMRIIEAEVLSSPDSATPIVINGREVNVSLDTLLNFRPITLRNRKELAIFKVQAELCRGFRQFFESNGFTEIHTPKLVSGSAEGGADVFRLDYFGSKAFLAQSPQFYKQIMVGVFGRVYEIAPVFRAEKHDTSRHINEYTSVDLEMGFITSHEELMEFETSMLSHVFGHIRRTCCEELEILKAQVPEISVIPAVTFSEAKGLTAKCLGYEAPDSDDLSPEEERCLCEIMRKKSGSELVFVTGYRSSKRPFYTMDSKDDPTVTESFDLLFRGLEVTTGGQRIHSYCEQIKKMEDRGMDVDAFKSYLMAHKYGLPPHGGMGIGLERLTARLLGFENVRRATMFPRDINRIAP